MKVFKVFVDKCSYDEYDSCVVVAESIEAVWAMMEHREDEDYPSENAWRFIPTDSDDGFPTFFYDHQGTIHIEEVDLNTPGVVLSSFNAG